MYNYWKRNSVFPTKEYDGRIQLRRIAYLVVCNLSSRHESTEAQRDDIPVHVDTINCQAIFTTSCYLECIFTYRSLLYTQNIVTYCRYAITRGQCFLAIMRIWYF